MQDWVKEAFSSRATVDDLKAIPPNLLSPALLVSFRTLKLELDVFGTPYALVRSDVRYFFSPKAGIDLSINYANLASLDKAVWQENEISTVDRVQTLFIKAGVVLRF